jgi:hypothetical protein
LSSILKALKKIEGRKVDAGIPAWPYGPESPESTDRHIHRCRKYQKILGLLIVLCGIALAGKLYIASGPKPETTVAGNTASPTAPLPQRSDPGTTSETQKNDRGQSQSTPAPQPQPQEAAPQTARPPEISSAPAESSQVSTPGQPREPAVTETFGTPPSGNAGLSLMTLVWSRQPESRFAVINGEIVREGAGIQGSTVVRIEEEYVVIRTDGVAWKLE